MAKFRITGPDGGTYEVTAPDDATEAQVLDFVRQNAQQAAPPAAAPAQAPVAGRGRLPRGDAIGGGELPPAPTGDDVANKWMGVARGFGQGYMSAGDAGVQMLFKAFPNLAPESFARFEDDRKRIETEYQAQRGDTGMDIPRAIGQAVGTLPFVAGIPGGSTLLGRTASGAAMGGMSGALQPVEGGDFAGEKAKQVGIGALSGGATGAVTHGVSRAMAPQPRPELRALMDAGVRPTPGQVMGGVGRAAEEKARSIPLFGDAVTAGERRALEQFNRATVNKALEPIGAKIADDIPVGRAAVDKAGEIVSKAYDDVLPRMTGTVDQQFQQDMQAVAQRAMAELPTERTQQFGKMMQNVFGKAGPGQTIGGEKAKEIVSLLNGKAAQYGKSLDPDQRTLGGVFREAADAFKAMMARGSPNEAAELAKVDAAYSMLLRVENAAGRLGSKDGVFTPAALSGAVRAMDNTMRKRGFARGNALMQDWAAAGENVLGNRIPDSGTAGRGMLGMTALTGGAGYLNPASGAALGVGALGYTPPGQAAFARLMAGNRGNDPMLRLLAQGIEKSQPGVVAGLIPLLLGGSR